MLGLEKRYEIARLIACELIGVLSGRDQTVQEQILCPDMP